MLINTYYHSKYDKAKIIMIACIAPDLTSTNHTLNTLRYSDRLKEKTISIRHTNTITGASPIMNKMLVNPLTNSTSDNSNLKLKNYLFDIDMNDSKNLKSQSKDFPILKTNSAFNVKNMIYEEIVKYK
jgi:kinesin family member 2/24